MRADCLDWGAGPYANTASFARSGLGFEGLVKDKTGAWGKNTAHSHCGKTPYKSATIPSKPASCARLNAVAPSADTAGDSGMAGE